MCRPHFILDGAKTKKEFTKPIHWYIYAKEGDTYLHLTLVLQKKE